MVFFVDFGSTFFIGLGVCSVLALTATFVVKPFGLSAVSLFDRGVAFGLLLARGARTVLLPLGFISIISSYPTQKGQLTRFSFSNRC